MAKSKVAVRVCTPETILTDIERLCEAAGMRQALAADRTTLLQGDRAGHHPTPGASTTPWQLEGAIVALRSSGFSDVTYVEHASRARPPRQDADAHGYTPLLSRAGVATVHTHGAGAPDAQWVPFRPGARMHVVHKLFPGGIRVPDVFFGKNVVHAPAMRRDRRAGVAGVMHNALLGLVAEPRRIDALHLARAQVDVLAMQREIHAGAFAIVDGTTIARDDGGGAYASGYLLAGEDQVAVDAVIAKAMGIDPMTIEAIRLAHDDRLGVGDPRDIDVVGDPMPRTGTRIDRRGAAAPWDRVETLVARAPLGSVLLTRAEACRDDVRWSVGGKRALDAWKSGSPWGRLFGAYERGENERIVRPHAGRLAPAV